MITLTLTLLACQAPVLSESTPEAGMRWADYDADGFADAVALLPGGEARLLRNLGDGTLEDVTALAGLPTALRAAVALWGDYDSDGALDLYLGSLDGESRLYRQVRDAFQDVTETVGLDAAVAPRAAQWIDYDGDGSADLQLSTAGGEVLYHGLGGTAFERVDLGLSSATVLVAELRTDERTARAPRGLPGRREAGPAPADSARGGVDGSSGGRMEASTSGIVRAPSGTAAMATGACIDSVSDQAGGLCVEASRSATLGMLHPMSIELNVDAATGRVGIGTTTPSSRLEVAGQILSGSGNTAAGLLSALGGGTLNAASGDQSVVAGGESNTASGLQSAIGGGYFNVATGDRASVAGGVGNRAEYRAFIGGGDNNRASGNFSAVAGGKTNQALGSQAFVGGGQSNNAMGALSLVAGGDGNLAEGDYSIIGGGLGNFNSGTNSCVLGGTNNSIQEQATNSILVGGHYNFVFAPCSAVVGGEQNGAQGGYSFVGGGYGNRSGGGQYGAIVGGYDNRVDSDYSFAGGGFANRSLGQYSAIVGGDLNLANSNRSFVGAGRGNQATGSYSAIVGGIDNIASGTRSAVLGGEGNEAVGGWSSVLGGLSNTAAGLSSVAAGIGADAAHDYAFVWNGSTGGLASTGSRQFLIGASGGVGINTNAPQTALDVAGGSDVTPAGGGFVQIGSTTGQNIALDGNEIMARNNGSVATLSLNADGGDIDLVPNGPGRVAIGSNSSSAKLDIHAEAGLDALRVRVNGTTRLLVDQSGSVVVGANITPSFDLQVSSSAPNGGTAAKPGGGSWSNSSDRRLKKNIEDLDGALDTLLALRGVTYEYKDPQAINELEGTRIGFIAQEVEDVLPDWVDEKPDGMKMLTIRGFEALAVEALRTLRDEKDAEIAALRAQLALRDGRLAAMEGRLGQLEDLLLVTLEK